MSSNVRVWRSLSSSRSRNNMSRYIGGRNGRDANQCTDNLFISACSILFGVRFPFLVHLHGRDVPKMELAH